jgi:hypothetical protein
MSKKIYDSNKMFRYNDKQGKMRAFYFPEIPMEEISPNIQSELEKIPFTRVEYISRFGKKNRTPRKTWSYGHVKSDTVTYSKYGQKLNFQTEKMPNFLKKLSDYCREISIHNWGFDPAYNSCYFIRKYNGQMF